MWYCHVLGGEHNYDSFVSSWLHLNCEYRFDNFGWINRFAFPNRNQVNHVLFNYKLTGVSFKTRTMNVSLAMMFGRSGAIIGNLMFPWLMARGCFPPFLMIGATLLGNSVRNSLNLINITNFSLQCHLSSCSNNDKKTIAIKIKRLESIDFCSQLLC